MTAQLSSHCKVLTALVGRQPALSTALAHLPRGRMVSRYAHSSVWLVESNAATWIQGSVHALYRFPHLVHQLRANLPIRLNIHTTSVPMALLKRKCLALHIWLMTCHCSLTSWHLLQARTLRRVSSAFESLKVKKRSNELRVNGEVVEVEAGAGRPARSTGRGDGARRRRSAVSCNPFPAIFSEFSTKYSRLSWRH